VGEAFHIEAPKDLTAEKYKRTAQHIKNKIYPDYNRYWNCSVMNTFLATQCLHSGVEVLSSKEGNLEIGNLKPPVSCAGSLRNF
jgi:hypothetical protein